MSYKGDIRLGETHDFKFTSRRFSTGVPFTLAGSPVISAYVGNSTTEITAGITLTVDLDGRTGLNNIRVVATSGNGFSTATDVDLVITTGTVDSVSVVGEVAASFSIENRSALMPTTAGRTAVVDAAGLIDANTVKVGPTGSGTAQTAGDIPARLPAALTAGGNMKSDALAINAVSTSSVTAVNANIGQTQPVNFTGTGASALVKTDMIDVNGVAYGSSTLNTLASHDPGATLGTSTLTQTQVTGGAYALNSASFAFNAALDFTTTQKAATLARVTLVDTTTTNTDMLTAAGVWAAVTRTLTAGTNIQLPSNGLANITAWTVNITGTLSGTVGGIAGTTQTLDALQTALNSAHGSGSWATATSVTVSDKTGFSLSSTGLDLVLVAGKTMPNAIRYIGATTAGKLPSGAGTATEIFQDFAGTTAVTFTVDSSGNRTAVTYAA